MVSACCGLATVGGRACSWSLVKDTEINIGFLKELFWQLVRWGTDRARSGWRHKDYLKTLWRESVRALGHTCVTGC